MDQPRIISAADTTCILFCGAPVISDLARLLINGLFRVSAPENWFLPQGSDTFQICARMREYAPVCANMCPLCALAFHYTTSIS